MYHMKKHVILILATFLMASCCSCRLGNAAVSGTDPAEEATKQLSGMNDLSGEWTIFSIEGKEVALEKEAFLHFNIQEKRVDGKAGCNHLHFAYETPEDDATAIAFKQGMSTRMMCVDMETEHQFLKICPEIASFSLNTEKNAAIFYDGEKREILILKKKD